MAEKVLADISPGRQVVKSKLPDPILRNIFFFDELYVLQKRRLTFLVALKLWKVRLDSGRFRTFFVCFFPRDKANSISNSCPSVAMEWSAFKRRIELPKKDCAIARFSFSQILDTIARHQKLPKLFVLCSNTQRCFWRRGTNTISAHF